MCRYTLTDDESAWIDLQAVAVQCLRRYQKGKVLKWAEPAIPINLANVLDAPEWYPPA